jgi:RNA-directed DNA polymerase
MTVQQIDRESGTTKLERVSWRSKIDPKIVFNSLGHIITEDLLHEAYAYLSARKAVGIDNVTKEQYGKDLVANIGQLIIKIRRGKYRPQASRIVQIPKEDGSCRPLAISCFEDKIVQWAVSKILEAVYEPLFLPYSYGFRPKLNCHEALREAMHSSHVFKDGALVEIDIRKCFNRIPHKPLMEFLKEKISDSRFLKLIEKLITAPTIEDGNAVPSMVGCPQGSIVSPILCNIFLHHVVDEWFDKVSRTHLKGGANLVRYADDMVFFFERKEDAKRIFNVLGKRLDKYGLEMHEEKSALLPSGSYCAQRMALKGERMPTFKFLGFTCYWGKARAGFWRLKLKSRSDRYTCTLKRLKVFLRENLTCKDADVLLQAIIRRIKGWINYHAVSDNARRVSSFLLDVKRILLKWFNRRGCKRAMTWHKLHVRLTRVGFPKTFKITSMFATKAKTTDSSRKAY